MSSTNVTDAGQNGRSIQFPGLPSSSDHRIEQALEAIRRTAEQQVVSRCVSIQAAKLAGLLEGKERFGQFMHFELPDLNVLREDSECLAQLELFAAPLFDRILSEYAEVGTTGREIAEVARIAEDFVISQLPFKSGQAVHLVRTYSAQVLLSSRLEKRSTTAEVATNVSQAPRPARTEAMCRANARMIREIMRAEHWEVPTVAKRADVSENTVYKMLRGEAVRESTMEKIAIGLSTSKRPIKVQDIQAE